MTLIHLIAFAFGCGLGGLLLLVIFKYGSGR